MADYISILNSQIEPKAPVTSELMFQLRDNPIATAEGAIGAPRIALGSLERLEAGEEIRVRGEEAASSSFVFEFLQAGTITVRVELVAGAATSATVGVNRTRGGITTAIQQGLLTLPVSIDVSVLPGDKIVASGALASPSAVLTTLRTGGQDLWPGSQLIVEGNTFNV